MSMKFVAWGVKLHTHTHSYIHSAYCKAFKHLGYEVYHLDDNDDISNLDLNGAIFLTAGICDKNIPLLKSAKYILHNCEVEKYEGLNSITLQVYTNDIAEYTDRYKNEDIEKIDKFVYFSKKKNCLYQPWATDLLPHEISDEYIINNSKKCVWVGSIWQGEHGNYSELILFVKSCQKYGYEWINFNPGQCSFEDNKLYVKLSEIAPSINGEWQKNKHYIPCRIFKNISYGKIGLTNNMGVTDLLDGNVIYGTSEDLLEKYLKFNTNDLSSMFKKSALLIKEKHTYINRINTILKFF